MRLTPVFAVGVAYVLGARAGRERESISRFWHRRPRSEWSRTARTGHWRRGSTTGGAAPPLRPDATSDLSDGIVVQAQLLGAGLGVRLLRIDGTVSSRRRES